MYGYFDTIFGAQCSVPLGGTLTESDRRRLEQLKLVREMEALRYVAESDGPPLYHAAYRGTVERVRSLLDEAENCQYINEKNYFGNTPLRLAATAGNVEIVTLLIDRGADTEIEDTKAQTPLCVAVRYKRQDCVEALLKKNVNPDGSKQSLCTPLSIAVHQGNMAALKSLICSGAVLDVSCLTMATYNSTPLYMAVVYKQLACFRELLKSGADPDYLFKRKTMGGIYPRKSLYHVCIEHNSAIIFVQLLHNFGASLYYKDVFGKIPGNSVEDNTCSRYVRSLYGKPYSLESHCRIQIRRHLLTVGKLKSISKFKSISGINLLPLPLKLKKFLLYEE